MACTTKDLYKSVKKCPGARIAPGIKPRVFFILKSQILTWPTLPAADDKTTDPAKLAQYTGDFTLASDAKWHSLDLVDAKSNFKLRLRARHLPLRSSTRASSWSVVPTRTSVASLPWLSTTNSS